MEIGSLTGLLARIKPAITATTSRVRNRARIPLTSMRSRGPRTNVLLGLDGIRRRSPILAHLEHKRTVQLVGGMYDLTTGFVEFFS